MTIDKKSDQEILEIANPIMDNLMDASTKINHEQHVRDFTDRIKAIVTKENLERMCKKYQQERGFFADRHFVAMFRRPGAVAIIWKQKYTKAEGDYVAEMLLIEQNSKYLVEHVMIW